MRPRSFAQLRDLATALAPTSEAGRRCGPLATFDCGSVGLILRDQECLPAYDCTPTNSDTFAETGGDGVHFGFLLQRDKSPDEPPIVMTVPMVRRNIIVGENLVDFLSLGCRFGYFSLEQLAYSRDRTIERIQSGCHATSDEGSDLHLLEAINRSFDLHPWPNVRAHLDELHGRYHALIELPERVE